MNAASASIVNVSTPSGASFVDVGGSGKSGMSAASDGSFVVVAY